MGKTGGPAGFSINRKFAATHFGRETYGVLAQLVERLNGIEEVRGSNPLGSTSLCICFSATYEITGPPKRGLQQSLGTDLELSGLWNPS